MMRWIEDRGDIEFYDNGKGKRFQKITFLNTVRISHKRWEVAFAY